MSKKAASGSGTIRKKTVTRNSKEYTFWEARITVGTDPGTGKQIQKSFTGKTQKEVREKMQAAAVDVNNGDYFEPSRITLKSWVELWLKEYTGDKKYLTVKHYKAQCNSHIIPSLGAVKLSALTVPQIQAVYNRLLRDGLAPKSVRNIHGILTKCLSTAVKVGYLRTNPASHVTLPKVEKKEIHPLTDDQVKQFLQIAGEDEYEILLKVILFTGLRESEAIGLTWDCVDLRKGTLKICKQLQKRPKQDGGFTFAPLKNDKTRILKPARSVMVLLERRWKEQAAQRLQAGDLWEGWQNEEERKTALVFTTMTGSNLSPQTVYNHYKKLAKRIGAPDSRVHDLRHTFATHALTSGVDAKTLSGILGHTKPSFTLDAYTHVTNDMHRQAAEVVGVFMKEFII